MSIPAVAKLKKFSNVFAPLKLTTVPLDAFFKFSVFPLELKIMCVIKAFLKIIKLTCNKMRIVNDREEKRQSGFSCSECIS